MISEKIGTTFKKNIRTKTPERAQFWAKLGIALILSNIFFFLLFNSDSEVKQESAIPEGWVEIQLQADLLTPFHSGKKVLIVHRIGRKKLEGVLQTSSTDEPGRITVLVKENEAHSLFQHESWEVLPFLKELNFVTANKRETHEIRY